MFLEEGRRASRATICANISTAHAARPLLSGPDSTCTVVAVGYLAFGEVSGS
jgi:hypothetical protein